MNLVTFSKQNMNFDKNINMDSNGSAQHVVVPFSNGFLNLGNSCYMNSVLVCLFNYPEMAEKLLGQHLQSLLPNNHHTQLVHHFLHLLQLSYNNNQPLMSVFIKQFHDAFFKENSIKFGMFVRGQQEDASEFLIYLVDWIKSSILQELHPSLPNTIYDVLQNAHMLFDDFLLSMMQTTTCSRGHVSSRNFQELLILNVHEDDTDLNIVINRHFENVHLPPCNCTRHRPNSSCEAYLCDICDEYTSAVQNSTVTRLPNILIINLKLFRADTKRNQVKK